MTHLLTNRTLHRCFAPQTPLPWFQDTIMVLTIIIILLAIVGNLLLIAVVFKNSRMHTFTNILIFHCACAELLRAQTGIFKTIDDLLPSVTWFVDMFMCKMFYFCMFTSLAAINIALCFIAVDRYFLVMKPQKKVFTKKILLFVLPSVWLVSIGFASPSVFSNQIQHFEGLGNKCVLKWPDIFDPVESPKRFTVVLFVFLLVLPFVVMTILYTIISLKFFRLVRKQETWREFRDSRRGLLRQKRLFCLRNTGTEVDVIEISDMSEARCTTVHQNLRNEAAKESEDLSASSKNTKTNDSENTRAKFKVVKMLIIIVVGFALSWVPIFTLQLLITFNSSVISCPSLLPYWVMEVAGLMQYLNSAINPCLYFGYSSIFRKGLVDLLRQCKLCCLKQH